MLAGIDMGYMINHAMFQRNGRVGYVLKPLALRSPDKTELARRTEHALVVTVCTLSSFMFRFTHTGGVSRSFQRSSCPVPRIRKGVKY